jgi:hypothetical protein
VSQFHFAPGKRIVSLYLLIPLLQGFRGYLHMQNLTQEEQLLCDSVFREAINISLLNNTPGKRDKLVNTNLLCEQGGKLDFASPYLRALSAAALGEHH